MEKECIVFQEISVLAAGAGSCCEDNRKRIIEMIFSSYPYIRIGRKIMSKELAEVIVENGIVYHL